MKSSKNFGNIYLEYLITFTLVVSFCVLALHYVGNSIKEKILKDYFQGKKVIISVRGIYAEKVGKYGGTKSRPIVVDLGNNQKAIDLGYITLDYLPVTIPSENEEANEFGAKTLIYYGDLLHRIKSDYSNNPTLADKETYLNEMAMLCYGMAGLIDQIAYYNGKNSSLAMPDESIKLVPVNIEPFDQETYLIKDYTALFSNEYVNLSLSKNYYDLFTSIGMVYASTNRLDNDSSEFIWIIKPVITKNTNDVPYTFEKTTGGYISLEKYIHVYFDLLRFNNNEKDIYKEDFRYYNLLKLFDLYTELYLNLSEDDMTNQLISMINAEVKNTVNAVQNKTTTLSTSIKIDFSPSSRPKTDLLSEFEQTLKTFKENPETNKAKDKK